MKANNKEKLFENMKKLNPSFINNKTINEAFTVGQGTTSAPPINNQVNNPQNQATNQTQPKQPRQPSDVQTLSRANQNTATVQKASQRINTAIEFPEAFRLWFSSLGYKPDNQAINIARVRTEIEKVMKSLGFK